MIEQLKKQLTSSAIQQRLERLADGAPASAPLSLRIELGHGECDWLAQLPQSLPFWYRSHSQRREFRLGIGQAMQIGSGGRHRFAALDNAFASLRRNWRHEGKTLAFAGFAFASGDEEPLPNALLAIPGILLESLRGQCSATLSIPAGRRTQAFAEWGQWLEQLPRRMLAQPIDLLPRPAEILASQAWIARCQCALRAITSGQLDKLVLARSRHLEARQEIAATALLEALLAQQPDSLIYAFGNGHQVFLGATPERLIRLQGGRIDADALAGTAWAAEPDLAGAKNRHEQSLVVRAVSAALAPLASTPPAIGETREQAAGQLRHLRSRITAEALPGTTLFDLLAALHPTPAVGGYPTAAALAWLAEHGEPRHGWYSGGIGYLDQDGDGEFSVALRSALLNGRTALLQAGAGIVAGSDPGSELAETEAKFGTIMGAFAAAGRQSRKVTGT
jgi:isochorismate synthase